MSRLSGNRLDRKPGSVRYGIGRQIELLSVDADALLVCIAQRFQPFADSMISINFGRHKSSVTSSGNMPG